MRTRILLLSVALMLVAGCKKSPNTQNSPASGSAQTSSTGASNTAAPGAGGGTGGARPASDDRQQFVGKWELGSFYTYQIELRDDGNGSFASEPGTENEKRITFPWKVENGRAVFTLRKPFVYGDADATRDVYARVIDGGESLETDFDVTLGGIGKDTFKKVR
jgi:hypothetical protein